MTSSHSSGRGGSASSGAALVQRSRSLVRASETEAATQDTLRRRAISAPHAAASTAHPALSGAMTAAWIAAAEPRHVRVRWPWYRIQADGTSYIALPVDLGGGDHVTIHYGLLPHNRATWDTDFHAAVAPYVYAAAPWGWTQSQLYPSPGGAQGICPWSALGRLATELRDVLLQYGTDASPYSSDWSHVTYCGLRPISLGSPLAAQTRSVPTGPLPGDAEPHPEARSSGSMDVDDQSIAARSSDSGARSSHP